MSDAHPSTTILTPTVRRRGGKAIAPASQPSPRQKRAAEDETRRDKFLRIGSYRMQRALHSIGLLGNLANTNYEYKEEDVEKMRQEILMTIEQTMTRFRKAEKRKASFNFD